MELVIALRGCEAGVAHQIFEDHAADVRISQPGRIRIAQSMHIDMRKPKLLAPRGKRVLNGTGAHALFAFTDEQKPDLSQCGWTYTLRTTPGSAHLRKRRGLCCPFQ